MSTISSGTTSTTTLIHSGDTTGSLVFKTNDTGSGGTTAVTIDTSQNVGIGTSSPSQKLQVNGGNFLIGTAGANAVLYLDSTSTYVRRNSSDGSLVFNNQAASNTIFTTSASETMRIDSSGNLLVGTTTPYSGTVSNFTATTGVDIGSSSTATSKQLQFVRNGTTGTAGNIYATAGSFSNYCGMEFVIENVGGGSQAGYLKFNTTSSATSAERMRIDSSGNVQLGYGGSSPTAATAPQGLSLTSSASTALQIYLLKQTQVEAHIGFKSSTDTNFYIGTSGGGGAGGIGAYGVYQQNVTNSWTSVSDERYKTELEPITNALEKVGNVRTVTGRFTYDEENGVTRRLPFLIAQDFLTALPEAVDQQDPEKLGLSYSDTIVLAFAAIKELKAINDQQAQTITALTARIEALEGK